MAHTVIVRWAGMESGEAAAALYDAVHPQMVALIESGKYPGLVAHTCSKTADGIVVVDVWEDAAAWEALFADPEARAAFEGTSVPQPATVEILETHNSMLPGS